MKRLAKVFYLLLFFLLFLSFESTDKYITFVFNNEKIVVDVLHFDSLKEDKAFNTYYYKSNDVLLYDFSHIKNVLGDERIDKMYMGNVYDKPDFTGIRLANKYIVD